VRDVSVGHLPEEVSSAACEPFSYHELAAKTGLLDAEKMLLRYNELARTLEMEESKPSRTAGAIKSKPAVRRTLQIITAVAFIVTVFYWPSASEGRPYLAASIVVLFVGLLLLRKWPSV